MRRLLLAAALSLAALPALAQDRTVRVISGFAAGGAGDLMARLIVVGAPNSSNSVRLREVAERAGAPRAVMVQRGVELDPALADGCATIGISAGASAPEVLVQEVVDRLRERFEVTTEEVTVALEDVIFRLPPMRAVA